ncbi:condensin-2 complex subunit D3 isoform X1 [Triplophysa rosa]|uniref:Condensin-2 complex subunit D3 n=1 Tax=Triplophysa rosa TaxID=992332 RepID=A0A9W8C8R0_TRIRA|nr:condensin-2 complex subunit D3 isoform X1 [Triplophysa rosa]KAI7810837.1 condensin-2 complex subunit D3 [Triplophysa rosa]
MALIRALQLLKLSSVSTAWVDAVWDFEFTHTDPIDPVIEEEIKENADVFKTVYMQLLPFSTDDAAAAADDDDDDDTQSVWGVFGENGVSTKALVAVLSYFILSAKGKSPSLEQRLCGLEAASLYLLLLKIPGSVANKVYHQILFDTCLNMPLKCWPQDSGRKRKKDSVKSSQGDPKTGKRSKPPKKVSEEMEIDGDEDDEVEEMYFSAQDLLKIREDIVMLIRTLLRLLGNFSLKDKPQSTDSCVQLFTGLTNFEPVIGDLSFSQKRNVDQLQSLPELAYHGLGILCSAIHGEGDECRRRVFRKLLYVILMMKTQERSKPCLLVPSQAVHSARDHAVLFISHIVDEQRETTLPLLRVLVQHICHQMVEKSEYRASGAQAVGKLMAKMPCQDYAALVKWLHNYSRNNKVAFRMFALDIAMALLEQDERDVDDTVDPDMAVFLSHRFLVHNIVYGHRNDISPTVRGHALHCLALCLELRSQNAMKCVHELFSNTGAQTMLETGRSEQTLKRGETGQKTALTFRTIELTKHKSITATHRSDINATLQNEETMTLFKKHVSDPKTNARKSALETVMSLLKHGVVSCSAENLSILSDRCRDPAVSVKKKAMQCLMDLLAALPDNLEVQEAWLRGVLPAVIDSESSVQEKALECLDHVILAHIKSQGKYHHGDTSQRLAWDLLGLMCEKCEDLSRYFSKAFSVWAPQQKFTPAFVNGLLSHTEGERAAAAWLLLAKIASCSPKLNYSTVLETWERTVRSPVVSVTMTCHILSVMGDISSNLNDDTKSRIVDDLMGWLKSFSLPLEVISSCVDTLLRFAKSDCTQDTMRFLDCFCGEMVSVCEAYLSSIILNEKGTENINEDLLVKHLYTLGVASLHCPSKVGKRIFLLVQSILTPSEQSGQAEGNELPASQPLSQFKANSLPTVVRAHAVIALGKLCLQHEELMLKYLPVFARELEVGTELAVRSNVVVVMCDLCVRYTNTVTRYIPNISACLRDKERIVREQTLIMLTNLLQEEYVKWKGMLFFRFAVTLVDSDPAIADLCEYCLVDLLLKKSPLMFSQHFIECIFHFNSYDKHKKYNKLPQTESEKSRFSLKGPQNQGKRFRIYKFLLKNFTDEQRFSITTKICQDILACFVDSELPLDSDGSELLEDTFDVLSLKEMKLTAMSGPAAGEEPQEDEMAMAKAVLQVAQKKLITQVQKKNFVENVIPIIISLKNMLEEQHSPVLKHIMAYLQVTMQDYRSEVKELFAADEQLAAEVEYNMKQFEKQKQEQQQMEKELANFTLSPRQNGNAVASPAQAPNVGHQSGFATPLRPGTKGSKQTPKSADALRRRTFAGMVTPVRSHPSFTVISTGRAKQVGRAISTPQASINEVTFGEQVSAICSESGRGSKNVEEEESILYLMSPEKQKPVHKQWNVESPLVKKNRSKKGFL